MRKWQQVINLDDLKIFDSESDAARYYGIHCGSVGKVCQGKMRSCRGYHFAFLNDYLNNTIPEYVPCDQYSVYKLTSPENKVYIGMAKDISHRWRGSGNGYKGSTRIYDAIQQFGWENFQKEILYRGLSRIEASCKEKELIAQYQSTNPDYGYNMQTGGIKNFQCSEESKAKQSKKLKGRIISETSRFLNALHQPNRKRIRCIETGEEYNSYIEASRILKITYQAIWNVCHGKNKTCLGYHWEEIK